jgi:hypothetical protein
MNPEFERQLWLELNPSRVVVMLLGLGALFTVTGALDTWFLRSSLVASTTLITFIVITVAWGGQRAGESVLEELRDRTWEIQRMSALSPWAMTWGKWLGATSYQWLGGGVCLGVFVATAEYLEPATRGLVCLQALGGALLVQGTGLLGATVLAGHPHRRTAPLGTKLVAGALSILYASLAFKLLRDARITWFGGSYPGLAFATVLLWCGVAWTALGALRAMAHELQVPQRPLAWFAFLLFASGVLAGFLVGPVDGWLPDLRAFAAAGLVCHLGAAYVAGFALVRDPLSLRRVARYVRLRDWRRASEETPLWVCALAGALPFALLAIVVAGSTRPASFDDIGWAALPLLLYALRDLLLLTTVSYGPHPARAEISTGIALGLLYWLVPGLCNWLGLGLFSRLVRPAWDASVMFSVPALAAQVVFVAWCARRAYRVRIAPDRLPQPTS